MEYSSILKHARIFEQLSATQMEEALSLLKPVKKFFAKGDVLIWDGHKVDCCFLLLEGTCAANKLYADGRTSLILKFVPSYIIGTDISATKTRISTYYVTALQDCVVYEFSYDRLAKRGILPEDTRLLMMDSLLALIAGENIRKMNKIEIISRTGLRDRILTFLSMQCSFYQSKEFDIPFSREEMAEYLCVNRSKLSHELSLMQQEGLISYRRNHFKVLTAPLYFHAE